MCEKGNPTTYQMRREYLTNYWKEMMGEKAAVYSHYGTKTSAWNVVIALGVLDASEVSSFYSPEEQLSTQKMVRYLLRLQNFMIITVFIWPCNLPDTIFSLYHIAKFTEICVFCTDNL
jgi:hypothetical protein